jgi:hypothetical protein
MSEHGIPQIIPIPDGEQWKWSCQQCAMNAGRDTQAAVLFVEGDGFMDSTGMCGNHAEVMDIEDLKEAQRRFDEEVGLS